MKALNDTESQRASNCLDNNLQPNPVGLGQEKSLFHANSSHKAPSVYWSFKSGTAGLEDQTMFSWMCNTDTLKTSLSFKEWIDLEILVIIQVLCAAVGMTEVWETGTTNDPTSA